MIVEDGQPHSPLLQTACILLDNAPAIEYNHASDTPRSSSGPGRRPFKAEITGSTPVRGTIFCGEAWYTHDLFGMPGFSAYWILINTLFGFH